MANRRTLDEQIDAALKEREQKDKRIKDLLERKRTKEDKARNHRLCKRGGLVEKLHPRLAKFTDEQFNRFVDLVLKSDQTKSVLDKIMPPDPDEADSGTDAPDGTPAPKPNSATDTPQGGENTADKPTETAAQGNTPPAQKKVDTPHHNGNSNGGGNHHQNNRHGNQHHNNGANGNGNGGNGARPTS